jgi:hypothetical protein
MYREAGARHHTAHFHAYYQENAAIFSIEPIEVARGALPNRQRRLVEAWAEASPARAFDRLGEIAERPTSLTY